MKNTSLLRRVLSVVLTVALLFTLLVPAVSAEKGKDKTVEELTLEPMDPGTLESQKLGRTETDSSIAQEAYALTDLVRVSIVLDKPGTLSAGFEASGIADNSAAMAYREGLRADQAAMTAKIEKAIGSELDVRWNITLAANFISANVLYGQIDTIKAIPGVKDVFLENRYEPQTGEKEDEPNNGSASYMIGSNITWANGYTGAGSKVAVIDTGADSEHQSFSGEGLEYALAQNAEEKGMSYDEYVATLNLLTPETIEAVKDQLNANIGSGEAAYRNTKIGYGYNYVDGNVSYIEHINDSQGEHGSHVSGIATGNRFIKVDGEFKPALEAVGTQGVAPDAQLVVMKVFGKGGGAYDSDYMVAIEDAIILGCDSANLSLGSGSAGFSFSAGYEDVMNELVENGLVVAMSAGNSYGWYSTQYNDDMYPYLYIDDVNYDTTGSPGSFTNSLTVASVDNQGQTGYPLMFGDLHVFYSETSGYGNDPISTLAGRNLEYVYFDNVGADGDGNSLLAPYADAIEGKVVLCSRGTSSFYQKVNAAAAAGAVACIIYNNQAGTINMNLEGVTTTIPAVSILQADGMAIKAQSEAVEADDGTTYYTGTMTIAKELEVQVPEVTDNVTVSSFSSYGMPGTLVLKPEILAPGGSIYSVNGLNNAGGGHDAYEVMSGTSMASPQVAGMAAVMGQYIRDNGLCEKTGLTARQLTNSLLMSTAHPVFDSYGEYWPVFRVGAGLGNVADATAAQSYILMDEESTMFPDSARDGKVKAELGDDPDRTGEYSFKFTVNPIEGAKEFTLRTDLFAQDYAGNGGYGLLQYTGTTSLSNIISYFGLNDPGYEVTYEVNGKTYEDSYPIEADVNMDGTTDAMDAQAILNYVAGELAEDADFDAEVADLDGDGAITTYDAHLILEAAATPTITADGPTEVTVHIQLSDLAMEVLDYLYNATYIEGYTFVDPVATKEGAMDVVHSIPILAFYGSWTDAAMMDRTSVIDEAYETGMLPYLANTNINYLTMKTPDGDTVVYMGNPYMVEDEFPADRLAMNSAATIQSYTYMPIRNSATQGFALLDEDGNVVFSQATASNKYSPYYYVNGGAWQNTSASSYNVGKTLGSAGLKEGDKVTVGFYLLPEYYAVVNAKNNGEVATTGGLDNAGFKAVLESGIVGDGAAIKYDVTVDDTAPVVKGALQDLITGDIYVKAQDNLYIAYVAITNKTGSQVFFETVPEQKAPGEEIEVPLELDGVDLPKEVVLLVGDYAGNEVAFKVNLGGNGGEEETYAGQMFGFVPAGSTVGPGSGNRVWTIDPATANVSSATSYQGVENFADVNFTVTAAEYVDGYVFMAADDGWFYAAALDELGEASLAAKFGDTVEKIYDMAYNYKNETMYVLGNDNTIYAMEDLVECNLIPAYKLVLPGVTGTSAEANRLAIDDNGVFYIGNYGTYSAKANLYKFVPEYEEAEPETPSELGNLVASWGFESEDEIADWTIIDANADGKTWGYYNYNAHTGSGCLSNTYNSSKAADDWAITSAVDLSDADVATLAFFTKNYGYDEKLEVYAGTSADPAEMTKLMDLMAPDNYPDDPDTVDLSDFVGEAAVYVGFHHCSEPDQFRIFLDDVAIYTQKEESEEPGEPEPVEALEVEPELVGSMGVNYNYSMGGAMAWDHNEGILYLVTNYNATNDTDHHLWTVNTETGVATKANTAGSLLRASVRGLFIVPGRVPSIEPTDEATDLIVEPEVLELLRGQSAELKVAVLPWTLTDKDVTFESADPEIASVKDGVVTGNNVGETTVTVTTVAEPHLTFEVTVIVSLPPEATLRGVIWDENGKGQASVFNTNATADWEALSVVGQFRWGALVGDTVYGSTDETMYAFDADTYEVTELGGIVSMWIPSDAEELPQDYRDAFAEMGYNVGPVIGPNNNGTYLTMLDPEAGSLIYFDFTDTFGSDPMALITYHHREDYTYIDWNTFSTVTDPDCAVYYVMTESGALYSLLLTHDGSAAPTKIADTGLDLTGVADATNQVWGSMVYNEENDFLYVSLYNGSDDYAYLYAIDGSDPTRMSCTGDFNESVWPVTGLYQYEPLTDLFLSVNPTELEIFETETAEINVKIKMGETNEYTAKVADPEICSFEDGVVTGLKEGETDITITTVDSNAAGEHLTETVHVTVKGLLALDLTVKGQVTDAKGARFTSILLDGPTAASRGKEAPFDVKSGARVGDLYLAADETHIVALDPETFEPVDTFNPDPEGYFSQYPAMDIANYPYFVNEDGEYDTSKALFTTNLGWIVKPDYYGWNLSSYLPDMAAISFCGLGDDGEYVYYVLTTAGALWEIDVEYASGSVSLGKLLDTGITVTDQSALSMAFAYGVNVHYTTDDEETYGLVIANNEDKTVWFIDFSNGEVGMVGTLEADNVSGLIGYYDELVAVDEEPTPQPYPVGDSFVKYDFEEEPTDWIFYDDDEDGYKWTWNQNTGSWFSGEVTFSDFAHDSEGSIMSGSFINTVSALSPDNWAFSPVIDLTEVEGTAALTFWAKSIDSKYPENFAVYVQVSGSDTPVKVMDDTATKADWTQYSIDLSDYVGQKFSVGFRNYNVTDQYLMALDDVEVLTNVEWVMPEHVENPFQAPDVSALTARVIGDGASRLNAVPAADIQLTKFGEATNAVVGGTNAIKGEMVKTGLDKSDLRKPVDDTVVDKGTVQIVLTEDVAVTNGLYTVTYDAEKLTFVNATSALELKAIHHEIVEPAEGDEPALKLGVVTFAFANLDEIAAETALLTLNFTYEGEAIETTVVVATLERNDDVAVEDESLVIEIKEGELPPEPPVEDEVYELIDVLKDGDKVVIYNPMAGMAVSNADLSAEQPSYRAGVAVTPEDNKIVNPETAIVWTVQVTETGVKFLDAEGHILSMESKGLELDKTNDIWEIRSRNEEDFTVNIVNTTAAAGSSGDPKAMEWYTKFSEFSTHYLSADDGQFIFELYAKTEGEEPPVEHDCKITHFTDVMEAYPDPENPYHQAIEWAFTHDPQITSGMNETTFGVGQTLTRAQAATFLYAAAGKPEFDETTAENPFKDVKMGKWYTVPVLWAYSEGLVNGMSADTYGVNSNLTRGQIMVILYAWADKPSVEGLENPYSDVPADKWFTNAAIWAYHEGIEMGTDGKFAQSTPCVREAMVLYLYRYLVH